MFDKTLIAAAVGMMALTVCGAQPVLAQSSGQDEPNARSGRAPDSARGDGVAERRNQRPPGRRPQTSAGSRSTDNRVGAQAVLTSAGIGCEVSDATLLGATADQNATYEVVCADGPGYLVVNSTPPQTFNCLELAGQAETNRLRDPEADVGQQCTLPANTDPVPVLSGFARDAGVDCMVEQGGAIGRSPAGNVIYEIGCADRDGFWLEKAADGWATTPCWDLALSDLVCRYTTPAEVLASWRSVLENSPAAACEVQRGRRIGRDAAGLLIYEIQCADDDGYFVRIDADWKARTFNPCATSRHLLGGCILTPVPAISEP